MVFGVGSPGELTTNRTISTKVGVGVMARWFGGRPSWPEHPCSGIPNLCTDNGSPHGAPTFMSLVRFVAARSSLLLGDGVDQLADEVIAGHAFGIRVEVGDHAVTQHRHGQGAHVLAGHVVSPLEQRPRLPR